MLAPNVGAGEGSATQEPAPPLPVMDLLELDALRVGTRPGLVPGAGLPSTAEEVDAFARAQGFDAECASEDGWFSDEDGVEQKMCGVVDVRVGETVAWLRFHLQRYGSSFEDGVPRLWRIELVPALGSTDLAVESAGQPRRSWSTAMAAEAQRAYGPPTRSRSEDVAVAVWRRPDRHVALVAPTSGDRAAALLHLGPDDPDRSAYGIADP